MKYTKLQQKKYDKIQKLVALLERRQDEKRKLIREIEAEIEEIEHIKFKVSMGMEQIDQRIKKKCRHVGGRHKGRRIYRDFGNDFCFIFCDDCGESVDRYED